MKKGAAAILLAVALLALLIAACAPTSQKQEGRITSTAENQPYKHPAQIAPVAAEGKVFWS